MNECGKTTKNENYTVYPIPIEFTRLHNKYMRRLFGKTDDNNNKNNNNDYQQ